MVSRTTTTTLILLALALAAAPAHADPTDLLEDLPGAVDTPESDPAESQWPNCEVADVGTDDPFVEVHQECLV